MHRTARALAVPLFIALALAGCGGAEDMATPKTTQSQQSNGGDLSDQGGAVEAAASERGSTEVDPAAEDSSPQGDMVTDDMGFSCTPENLDEVEGLCVPEGGPATRTDDGKSDAWPAVDDAEEKGYFAQGQFTVIGFAIYLLTIPADAPKEIEQYRKNVGAEPAGYIKIDVDNTSGEDHTEVQDVTLVDESGETYTYEPLWMTIGDWQESVDIDSHEATYDAGTELYNKYLDGDVPPTAKRTVWFIGPEAPEKMTYVEMSDREGAHEASPLA